MKSIARINNVLRVFKALPCVDALGRRRYRKLKRQHIIYLKQLCPNISLRKDFTNIEVSAHAAELLRKKAKQVRNRLTRMLRNAGYNLVGFTEQLKADRKNAKVYVAHDRCGIPCCVVNVTSNSDIVLPCDMLGVRIYKRSFK